MKNKLTLALAVGFLQVKSFAQFKVPKSNEVFNKIKQEGNGWIDIINYILGFMVFAGAIYVIAGLIGKREMSKGILITWILCFIIWGIANTVILDR